MIPPEAFPYIFLAIVVGLYLGIDPARPIATGAYGVPGRGVESINMVGQSISWEPVIGVLVIMGIMGLRMRK